MHRRRKRVLLGVEERHCAICNRTVSTLLTMLGSDNSKPLKTNVVDSANRCGHDFCEQCLQAKFAQAAKPLFDCPICGAIVNQKQLKTETIAEVDAVREREKRKTVKKIRCKNRESFANTPDYENYLDESEELVWNLVNYMDVKKIEQNLKELEQANKKEIEHMESVRNTIRRDQQASVSRLTDLKRKTESRFRQIDLGLISEDDGINEEQSLGFGAVTLIQPQPISLGVNVLNGNLSVSQVEMKASGFNFQEANRYSQLRLRNELHFTALKL